MTCEERHDLFLLDAIGALEPAESQALRMHLATGCVQCAAAAAEARAIAENLPLALPTESAPKAIRDRLMDRIDAASKPAPAARERRMFLGPIIRFALAACIGIAIGAGAMWLRISELNRLLLARDLQFVALGGSQIQPEAKGRVLWDKDHSDWHVYVFDMKPPAPGKQYELWFITTTGLKIAAGVFDVDANGQAHVQVHVPPNIGPLAAAAITDEEAGGVAVPAGQVQLVGKIQ